MMIHMKPEAKKHGPFVQPHEPAMLYILWNLSSRNKAVISWQTWCSAIDEIGWK